MADPLDDDLPWLDEADGLSMSEVLKRERAIRHRDEGYALMGLQNESYDATAIGTVARYGDVETVRFMIAKCTGEAEQQDALHAAWHGAIERHSTEVLGLLFDIDPRADEEWLTFGREALLSAADRGGVEIARFALERSVDAGVTNDRGWTALQIASDRGHAPVVEVLLDGGADPDALGPDGQTALSEALVWGHLETAALLLQRGASFVGESICASAGCRHCFELRDRCDLPWEARSQPPGTSPSWRC